MPSGNDGVSWSSQEEQHVLVIITGGTIGMVDSPDGLVPASNFIDNCLRPSSDFNDGTLAETTPVTDEQGDAAIGSTLRAPPRNNNTPRCKYTVFEFANLIDSSSMDGEHWKLILRSLVLNWNTFDAFVVLHGTDTLAYTASALAFMLGQLNKTVIVTGSQLSMYVSESDAHDNLLDSLTVAAMYTVPEVGVVFHHRLYRATRVTKVSAFSVAAFTTPNARALASFPRRSGRPWAAIIHQENIKSAVTDRESCISDVSTSLTDYTMNLDTSRVAVLKVYPGISADLIRSVIQIPNLGGLVLETFGAGNTPIGNGSRGLLEILATAVRGGVVVVSVTQCKY